MRALFYLFALLYGLTYWYMPTHDPDLGWHLLGGSWSLSHGAVPVEDLVNTFGAGWVDYHWLSQILFYKIYDLGGYEGLRLALGLGVALLFMLIAYLIDLTHREKAPDYFVPLLSFLIVIQFIIVSIRPHILSLILISQSLIALQSSQFKKLELPILFTAAVLGANIHVYWVFIPFLWVLFRLIPRLVRSENYSALYCWSGLVLLSSAGFISPYGLFTNDNSPYAYFANYLVIYDYLVMPKELRSLIHELKPGLAADGWAPLLVLAVVFIVGRTLKFSDLKTKLGTWLSAIISFILALRTLKFLSLLGVFGAPIITSSLHRLFDRDVKISSKFKYLCTMCFLLAGSLYLGWHAFMHWPWSHDNSIYMREYLPVSACQEIPKLGLNPSKNRDHVRVLTHFNHGGWCRWASYEADSSYPMKVTTDGRTQLVPVEHYQAGFDLYGARKNWALTLAAWDPDVVVVEKSSALAQFLIRAVGQWQLRYQDDFFALFTPIGLQENNKR